MSLHKKPVVSNSVNYIQKIYKDCLKAEKEEVLILSDGAETLMISKLYYLAALQLGLKAKLITKNLTEAVESQERKSIIIFNKSKTKLDLKKSFRKFCEKQQHKFIFAAGLNNAKISKVIKCFSGDNKKLRQKQEEVKEIMDSAKEVHITTKTGTDVYFNIKNIDSISDGTYDSPGLGGNLPFGEVYMAPKRVEGTVMVDVSSKNKNGTSIINHPITLSIENSKVTQIINGINGRLLEKTITEAENRSQNPGKVRKIAELGIGLNPMADVCGVTVIDEKVLNTAHIAIGSNHWFGGNNKTSIHVDQVFNNPVIEVDGQIIKPNF